MNAAATANTTKHPEAADFLQHLRVEETFARLREIFVKRWGVFLCISGVAVVVQFLLSLAVIPLLLAMGLEGEHSADEVDSSYTAVDDDQPANYDGNDNARRWLQEDTASYTYDGGKGTLPMVALVLNFCLYYIVVAVADGALIRSVAELYVSRIPSPLAAAQCALRRIVPLVGTPILVILAVVGPCATLVFLALLIPSFGLAVALAIVFMLVAWWISIVTYHTYPVIIVEVPPRGITGSLKRSWDLSAGHREYIFLVVFLFGCFKLITKWVLDSLLWTLGNYYVSTVVDLAYLTFTAALGSILQAIVYFSVRTAKEGLTVDILAQELQVNIDTPYESMEAATELVDNKVDTSAHDKEEASPAAQDSSKETPLV